MVQERWHLIEISDMINLGAICKRGNKKMPTYGALFQIDFRLRSIRYSDLPPGHRQSPNWPFNMLVITRNILFNEDFQTFYIL